jgi:hypothetical protein
VPEQEFLPPRPPAGSYVPDRDEDPPPWAGLPPVRPRRAGPGGADDEDARPEGPGGRHEMAGPGGPRGRGGRAGRAAARRRRRWLLLAGGLAVLAGAVTAVVLLATGRSGPAAGTGGLVTVFQNGELQRVPDACKSVPAATVQRYLPGKAKVASPLPVNGAAESACNWTVDHAPVYRLLELSLRAFAPNGLASGNGSATSAAEDAYGSALAGLRDPPRRSPAPRAAVTALPGLGDQAFRAMQVFRVGGAVTDVATVVVRHRNVVVTVTLNGLDHSNRGSYGPVSQSQLTAAALAFAQAAEGSLR